MKKAETTETVTEALDLEGTVAAAKADVEARFAEAELAGRALAARVVELTSRALAATGRAVQAFVDEDETEAEDAETGAVRAALKREMVAAAIGQALEAVNPLAKEAELAEARRRATLSFAARCDGLAQEAARKLLSLSPDDSAFMGWETRRSRGEAEAQEARLSLTRTVGSVPVRLWQMVPLAAFEQALGSGDLAELPVWAALLVAKYLGRIQEARGQLVKAKLWPAGGAEVQANWKPGATGRACAFSLLVIAEGPRGQGPTTQGLLAVDAAGNDWREATPQALARESYPVTTVQRG